jgi:hypothetical protein
VNSHEAAELAQLEERLRQEREIFDQKKKQDHAFFYLRVVMGGVAIAVFLGICVFSGYVILNTSSFSVGAVTAATTALLVEALGLVVSVWRIILGSGPQDLEPTTEPLP